MYYRRSLGASDAVGIDVRHNVMADDSFAFFRKFEIDVVQMRLHLGDLFVGYVKTERFFALRQREPQPAEKSYSVFVRKRMTHFAR